MENAQPSELVRLHKESTGNREAILKDCFAFCFHCLNAVRADHIKEWIDDESTAICPLCGIDSLISNRHMPETIESKKTLLREMKEYYFGEKTMKAFSMKEEEIRSVTQVKLHEKDMTISELQRESHQITIEKGFWDKKDDGTYPSIGEKLMLTVSELSEAMEELRKDSDPTLVYIVDGKPEGFGVELADAVIRIADLAEKCGVNLSALIRMKMRYNRSRPHKHNKAF